jgi:hypothetical protein
VPRCVDEAACPLATLAVNTAQIRIISSVKKGKEDRRVSNLTECKKNRHFIGVRFLAALVERGAQYLGRVPQKVFLHKQRILKASTKFADLVETSPPGSSTSGTPLGLLETT